MANMYFECVVATKTSVNQIDMHIQYYNDVGGGKSPHQLHFEQLE